MIEDTTLLPEMVRRIVENTDPHCVILFGSRARQDSRPESDFDFLVIADSSEPRYRRSAPLYTLMADLPAEVEVVVYTPEEVEEWEGVPQSFIGMVLREGTVVYEREVGRGARLATEGPERSDSS